MATYPRYVSVFGIAVVLLSMLIPPLDALASSSVTGTQLVSSVRSGRTTFDFTYRITVQNGSPGLSSAVATVGSLAATTVVLKGAVTLGSLSENGMVTSTDTFTIRQDRSVPFNPSMLVWTVTGKPGRIERAGTKRSELDAAGGDNGAHRSGSGAGRSDTDGQQHGAFGRRHQPEPKCECARCAR